jgi:nucleoside-diphosphate-sugar epimerase
MSFLVVGTNGNFSTQLQETARIDRSLIIDKSVYGNWENKNYTLISKITSASEVYELKYLINTVGIISKNFSNDFITYWNYLFPKHLYQICQDLNLTLVTLGSIHETVPEMCVNNPYLESKKKLEQFLAKNNFMNSAHFQFHTWYGGRNVNYEMFLGQIINALKNKTVFKMSDGKQIREYHHISDDATCVIRNLEKEIRGSYGISHGEKLSLEEIARKLFTHFGSESLLNLNSSISPKFEIRKETDLNLDISEARFRPTMEGLIDYVEKNI